MQKEIWKKINIEKEDLLSSLNCILSKNNQSQLRDFKIRNLLHGDNDFKIDKLDNKIMGTIGNPNFMVDLSKVAFVIKSIHIIYNEKIEINCLLEILNTPMGLLISNQDTLDGLSLTPFIFDKKIIQFYLN
jgi:hypothetical protein